MSDTPDIAKINEALAKFAAGEWSGREAAADVGFSEVEWADLVRNDEQRGTLANLSDMNLLEERFRHQRLGHGAIITLAQIARDPNQVREFAERNDVSVLETQRKSSVDTLNSAWCRWRTRPTAASQTRWIASRGRVHGFAVNCR